MAMESAVFPKSITIHTSQAGSCPRDCLTHAKIFIVEPTLAAIGYIFNRDQVQHQPLQLS